MNCQAQTFSPRACSPLTTAGENWLQYVVPSPDLIRTVLIPCACAFFAIPPSLPCEEWLRYQIHMPLPASGVLPVLVPLVWDVAPPASGPNPSESTPATAAVRTSALVRRRERMDSRLRTPK